MFDITHVAHDPNDFNSGWGWIAIRAEECRFRQVFELDLRQVSDVDRLHCFAHLESNIPADKSVVFKDRGCWVNLVCWGTDDPYFFIFDDVDLVS